MATSSTWGFFAIALGVIALLEQSQAAQAAAAGSPAAGSVLPAGVTPVQWAQMTPAQRAAAAAADPNSPITPAQAAEASPLLPLVGQGVKLAQPIIKQVLSPPQQPPPTPPSPQAPTSEDASDTYSDAGVQVAQMQNPPALVPSAEQPLPPAPAVSSTGEPLLPPTPVMDLPGSEVLAPTAEIPTEAPVAIGSTGEPLALAPTVDDAVATYSDAGVAVATAGSAPALVAPAATAVAPDLATTGFFATAPAATAASETAPLIGNVSGAISDLVSSGSISSAGTALSELSAALAPALAVAAPVIAFLPAAITALEDNPTKDRINSYAAMMAGDWAASGNNPVTLAAMPETGYVEFTFVNVMRAIFEGLAPSAITPNVLGQENDEYTTANVSVAANLEGWLYNAGYMTTDFGGSTADGTDPWKLLMSLVVAAGTYPTDVHTAVSWLTPHLIAIGDQASLLAEQYQTQVAAWQPAGGDSGPNFISVPAAQALVMEQHPDILAKYGEYLLVSSNGATTYALVPSWYPASVQGD